VHEADHSSPPYSVEVKNERIIMLHCRISTKTQDTCTVTQTDRNAKQKRVQVKLLTDISELK
jgi:hypothetical protein